MAYSQIRDVVRAIQRFHSELRAMYDEFGLGESDERLQLLLQYMGRHEQHISQVLQECERESAEGLLDTWLQFSSAGELKQIIKQARQEARDKAHAEMTAEEIIGIALEVDRRLVEFYDQASHETNVPRVQAFFESLLSLEQGKDIRYARTVLGIDDV